MRKHMGGRLPRQSGSHIAVALPIAAGAAHCNSIQVVQLSDLLGEPSTPALDVVSGPCRL